MGVDLSQFEGSFEKLPRLNDVLKKTGDSADVVFQDDGKTISADVLAKVYKVKGIKGIKAKDTFVFEAVHDKERKSLFVGSTSYTNLRELAAVKKANKNTLVGAKVRISRIAENDPNTANLKIEAI